MQLVEAVDYLRRRRQEDKDTAMMLALIVESAGFADMFDWADAHPDQAIALATQQQDIEEQFAEFDRRLSTGDLS